MARRRTSFLGEVVHELDECFLHIMNVVLDLLHFFLEIRYLVPELSVPLGQPIELLIHVLIHRLDRIECLVLLVQHLDATENDIFQ